jgi:hypothetical protein
MDNNYFTFNFYILLCIVMFAHALGVFNFYILLCIVMFAHALGRFSENRSSFIPLWSFSFDSFFFIGVFVFHYRLSYDCPWHHPIT